MLKERREKATLWAENALEVGVHIQQYMRQCSDLEQVVWTVAAARHAGAAPVVQLQC